MPREFESSSVARRVGIPIDAGGKRTLFALSVTQRSNGELLSPTLCACHKRPLRGSR
jgi:hypothetical protein